MPRTIGNVPLNCQYCGKEFKVYPYRKETAQYCSRRCLALVRLPKFQEEWGFKPTGRPKHKYKRITVNGERIREHRWIMEQHLGRKLQTWEHVHHINDDPSDNRLENLCVLSHSDHLRLEANMRRAKSQEQRASASSS